LPLLVTVVVGLVQTTIMSIVVEVLTMEDLIVVLVVMIQEIIVQIVELLSLELDLQRKGIVVVVLVEMRILLDIWSICLWREKVGGGEEVA